MINPIKEEYFRKTSLIITSNLNTICIFKVINNFRGISKVVKKLSVDNKFMLNLLNHNKTMVSSSGKWHTQLLASNYFIISKNSDLEAIKDIERRLISFLEG